MGGESKWRKIKLALGVYTRLLLSKTTNDCLRHRMPTTPTPSFSGLRLSTHSVKSSSEQKCAICLKAVKATNSQAIFTAECSHSFHFHCITSNVKHGNRICPVCRAKWKEVPLPKSDPCVKSSTNSGSWSRQDCTMGFQNTSPQQLQTSDNFPSQFLSPEPPVFDDDEIVNQEAEDMLSDDFDGGLEMKTYPEVSAVARSTCFDNFGILINLKAPVIRRNSNARAPIDLVTVLDVSGSMGGIKIALLKQAMSFLVQNLGPLDRLSVVAFASSAHRLFPLRLMTETGKQESLKMINSLVADGGTYIAEALKKGAKVMTDRNFKNPVSSLILLSDGHDTINGAKIDYEKLLPSFRVKKDETRIPIHTFGFGMDHDAHTMHFIAEHSGGTFSFIESESVIQDAFAQCIAGLLSVVVQDLRVEVACIHPVLRIGSIKAGSYKVGMDKIRRSGFIEVGDLYAEEQRDFLVEIDVPVEESGHEMSLVKFEVTHKDPIRKTAVNIRGNEDVKISRPDSTPVNQVVSTEVDRQRNRYRAASAISEAQTEAEHGNLKAAVAVLEDCRNKLLDSVSGRSGDPLCAGLAAELGQMMDRMVSQRVYEFSGRAYVLSGLSSHSWQRATARGDSTELTSQILSYQTWSMVNMVNHSQVMSTAAPPQNKKSFSSIL